MTHTLAQPIPTAETDAEETPLVGDDLLIEEISIDGMCGVY
jgi:mycofactocin precursor